MTVSSVLGSLSFKSFQPNSRGEVVTSVDESGKYLVKVQLAKNERKARDIKAEYEIMKSLNAKGSQTCPTAHEYGKLSAQFLKDRGLDASEGLEYEYIVQDFVPSDSGYGLPDVLLSLIEQKKLGVYQGDIKPANIRYNSKTGVCVFIDYDQAEELDQVQSNLSNHEFLRYCDERDKTKYGIGNWLRHFNSSNVGVESWFENGALNLANTEVFRLQKTTNSTSGIYHTINSRDVFVVGSRGLDRRAEILNAVQFEKNERVLDVGCNAGLLSEYLYERGCNVTGVDNDPHIVIAAKIVANILGKNIAYSCMDLDYVDSVGSFNTIMLFSVFHHTRNPVVNAKKITSACNRIIIETRLVENGKQPVNGQWTDTTRWQFGSLDKLTEFLEKLFDGFKFTRNLGFADKGRYILELVKK